ncbi:MAG: WG repeat-containing protein [Clostridia bacterium]
MKKRKIVSIVLIFIILILIIILYLIQKGKDKNYNPLNEVQKTVTNNLSNITNDSNPDNVTNKSSSYFVSKTKVKTNTETNNVVNTTTDQSEEVERFGVIDSDGNVIIENKYTKIIIPNYIKPIFICYSEDGTSQVLNNNKEVIFGDFKEISPITAKNSEGSIWYEDNILTFKRDGKMGAIDFNGNILLDAEYDDILGYAEVPERLILVQNGRKGFASTSGKIISTCKYVDITIDNSTEKVNIINGVYANKKTAQIETIKTSDVNIVKPDYKTNIGGWKLYTDPENSINVYYTK